MTGIAFLGAVSGGFVNSGDPEELLNADDWEFVDVSLVAGKIVYDSGIEQGQIIQDMPPELAGINNPYVITVTVDSITQGYLSIGGLDNQFTAPGTYIIPTAIVEGQFALQGFDFCDAVVSLLSLKLLNDNQLESELISNGSFASGADWTLGGDWQISGGTLNYASVDTQGYALSIGASLVNGGLYKVSLTVTGSNVNGPLLYAKTGPASYNDFGSGNFFTDGTESFTVYILGDANGGLAIYEGFELVQVDNISLKKYTLPS